MASVSTVRVRDISDLVTKGTTPTSVGRAFVSRGINFIKVETITSDGRFIPGKEGHVDSATHAILRRSQLAAGDILFSIAGALGRSTVVEDSWLPANTNQAFAIIRLSRRRGQVDHRYLLWQLRSPAILRTVSEINVQAAQANLSLAQVRDFEIPILPIDEQRAIADTLEDVSLLVGVLERLRAKTHAVKQGMMQQLLTGKVRLPGYTAPWQSRRLSDMLTYEQPSRYLVQTSKQLDAGRIPVLTAGKTFVLGYTNETHGVYTGHPVIIFDDFTTASKYVDFDFKAKSSAMKILRAKAGANLRFVHERMQLIDFPLGDHKRHWISEYSKQDLLAPAESEQAAISAVLEDLDAELETLSQRLMKAAAMKQGLMQQLLTGRTRLPVQEPVS